MPRYLTRARSAWQAASERGGSTVFAQPADPFLDAETFCGPFARIRLQPLAADAFSSQFRKAL